MPISIPTSVAGISIPGAVNGPLNLLYGNKYNTANFRFPRDVGSNPTRQHVILFTINEPDPNQTPQLGTSSVSILKATPGAAVAVGSAVVGGIINAATGKFDDAKKEVGAIAENADVQTIVNETESLTRLKLARRVKSSIALYVPENVRVDYSADYNNSNLTDALGKNYFLAQGAVSIFNTLKDSDSVVNAVNKAGNDPFVRLGIAKGIDKVFGTDLGDFALQSGGFALNPQVQVLFQGIDFRQFSFDFVLTPYSQEESDMIHEIIKQFKYASAPEMGSNGVFNKGLFMKIPDTFGIKFLYKGAENLKVNRIGECVLQDINVDYSGSGTWATHNDGSPVQIKLSLRFKETIIIDKNRITEGY
jgi:hypothetical protein